MHALPFRSIRWRLPLTYALIALLAALLLGAVLLTTLRSYYADRELDYLHRSASAISGLIDTMLEEDTPLPAIQAQFDALSFLSQTRVRLWDGDRQLIADSGMPSSRELRISSVPMRPPFEAAVQGSATPMGEAYASVIFVRDLPVPPNSPEVPAQSVVRAEERIHLEMDSRQEIAFAPEINEDRLFVSYPPQDVILPDVSFGFSMSEEGRQNIWRSAQTVELPLAQDGAGVVAYLELTDGPAFGSAILDSVLRGWVLASVVAVAGAAIAGGLVSRTISQPLLALTAVTARMSEGNLSARANVHRDDEFGTLARSFNEMASRVEETVVTLRRFVADAAHEIHTPLTALHANLELALSEETDSRRIPFIERAQEQVRRLEAMTISLLDLSRIEMKIALEERREVNLVQLVLETSELYASRAEQAGIELVFELPTAPVTLGANESQLRRVVCNLLDNAIKFTPEGGAVRVGVEQRGSVVALWVSDTGIGIPAEDIPYLFNRFHRARNAASYPGSGLGLAIIKAVVESHCGHVAVESGSGGTRFSMCLPLAE